MPLLPRHSSLAIVLRSRLPPSMTQPPPRQAPRFGSIIHWYSIFAHFSVLTSESQFSVLNFKSLPNLASSVRESSL